MAVCVSFYDHWNALVYSNFVLALSDPKNVILILNSIVFFYNLPSVVAYFIYPITHESVRPQFQILEGV